jgi:hypothetical protein
VRASVVVDAGAGRLGQVSDAAAVEVLDHQQQRLVADLDLVSEHLPQLHRLIPAPLGAAREEVAEEGAARAEHAPVHAQLGRAGRRDDARVGEEAEVVGAEERGSQVVGEAAQGLHVRGVLARALHGDAVGVGGREGGDLAVHGLHCTGPGVVAVGGNARGRRSQGWRPSSSAACVRGGGGRGARKGTEGFVNGASEAALQDRRSCSLALSSFGFCRYVLQLTGTALVTFCRHGNEARVCIHSSAHLSDGTVCLIFSATISERTVRNGFHLYSACAFLSLS